MFDNKLVGKCRNQIVSHETDLMYWEQANERRVLISFWIAQYTELRKHLHCDCGGWGGGVKADNSFL